MSLHARRPSHLLGSLHLTSSVKHKPISSPTDLRILLNVTSPLPHRRRNAPPPPLDLQPPTPPPKAEKGDMFVVSPRTPRTPQTGRSESTRYYTPRSVPQTPKGSHHLKSPKTPGTPKGGLLSASIRARKEKLGGISLKSPIGVAVNSPTHISVNKSNSVEGMAGFSYIFSHQKERELVISKPVVRPVNDAPPLDLSELKDPRSPGFLRGRVGGVGPMGGLGMDMGPTPVFRPETPFLRPPPSPWANAMI